MAETITVVVATSPAPRQTQEWTLQLDVGATVADALRACALDLEDTQFEAGIWGRPVTMQALLYDGDRIDWCRPRTVDPKIARRERFKNQGARTAGLFTRRPGGL